MRKYQIQHDPGQAVSPFLGGGIGYFAYELGRQSEVLPVTTRDVMGIPECYICFYNSVIIYNHEKEKVFISYFHPGCDCGIGSIRQLTAEINAIPPGLYRAKGISPGWKTLSDENMWAYSRGDFTRQQYIEAINGVDEKFAQGICGEDDDFSNRMKFSGVKPVFAPSLIGIHQNHTREDANDRKHSNRYKEEGKKLRERNVLLMRKNRQERIVKVNTSHRWGDEKVITMHETFRGGNE